MRSKKNIILLFLVLSGIMIAYINYSQEEIATEEIATEVIATEEIATEEIATEETYLEYWIFLLTIISLLLLAYNFHLFRLKNFWVKNNQLYLTPEEWGKIIKSNSYELGNNSEQLKKMTSIFSSMRNEMKKVGMTTYILDAVIERNNKIDRPQQEWTQDVGRAIV